MPISSRRKAVAVVASGVAVSAVATTLYAPASGLDLNLGILPIDLSLSLGGRPDIKVAEIGRLTGLGAEIVAYDKRNDHAWVTDAIKNEVGIVDLADPTHPMLIKTVSLARYGFTVTSVAISGKHVVVGTRPARPGVPGDASGSFARGTAVLMDLEGNVTDTETVGFGPDAVTFAPDGGQVLIANEGEPQNYQPGSADPNGSVSILKVKRGQFDGNREVVFTALTAADLSAGVRIASPAPTIAQDLEPEYIAVTDDSRRAFVSLQENNAVAEINLATGRVAAIRPAGTVDHSKAAFALDASDEDGPGETPSLSIRTFPELFGMRMPDGVATFQSLGRTYYVTANEGDQREYAGLTGGADSRRLKDIPAGELPTAWGASATDLRKDGNLGRLTVTRALPWIPGGPIYTYGSRSFSIFDDAGTLVYDSGNAFEQITSTQVATLFNSELGKVGEFDKRSDNKGPEPEGVAVEQVFGRQLAVITLERTGGIMVFDVTDPQRPSLITYLPGDAGNPAPEGVQFIEQGAKTLILVASEGDGTAPGALTVYQIRRG